MLSAKNYKDHNSNTWKRKKKSCEKSSANVESENQAKTNDIMHDWQRQQTQTEQKGGNIKYFNVNLSITINIDLFQIQGACGSLALPLFPPWT